MRQKYTHVERWMLVITLCSGLALASATPASAQQPAAAKKPNVLVIWGDDIGYWNVSAYNQGMMGYMSNREHR